MKLKLIHKNELCLTSGKKGLTMYKYFGNIGYEDWYFAQDIAGNASIIVHTGPFYLKQFRLTKLVMLPNVFPMFLETENHIITESRDSLQVLQHPKMPRIVREILKETGTAIIGVAEEMNDIQLLLGRVDETGYAPYITLYNLMLHKTTVINKKTGQPELKSISYGGMDNISLYLQVVKQIVEIFTEDSLEEPNERGTN